MKKRKKLIKSKSALLLSVLMVQSAFLGINPVLADEAKKPQEVVEQVAEEESPAQAPNKGDSKDKKEDSEKKEEKAEENKEEKAKPKEAEQTIANIISGDLKSITDEALFQIEIGFQFEDGSFDKWASGTGFLISNKEILTAQSLIDTSTSSNLYKNMVKERADAYKRIGVSLSNEKVAGESIKVFITNSKGERKEVTSLTSKNGMGLITLPKALATEISIFQDANKVNKTPDKEVAIKFDGKDDEKSDAQIISGKIKENENKEAKSYLVSADTSNGNPLGAPVLDESGNVIGMVSSTVDPMTVIPNDAIETYLIANNIKYKTVLSLENEKKEEERKRAEEEAKKAEELIVDTKPLEKKIKEVEKLELKEYTDETVKALNNSVEEGKKLLKDKEVTNDQIKVAVEKIDTAQKGLVKKTFLQKLLSHKKLLLLLGGGFLFVIALVVIFIVVKKKKNANDSNQVGEVKNPNDNIDDFSEELRRYEQEDLRRAQSQSKQNNAYEQYPTMARKGSNEVYDEGLDVTDRSAPKNLRIPRNANVEGVQYADPKYTESSGVQNLGNDIYANYDEGDEGTTFLNAEELPTLTRRDTGEVFKVNDGFVIGKQVHKTDYTIRGNSTVSRTHARIRKIGNDYYIEDLSSKNYTYLNGNQIAEYKPALLKNGYIIRLSNVEFMFEEA